ncbi:ribonucleoside-diphosphate reductase beta chain [Carnobacterium iners]|uniref:ribonucleoside-diphosphate reductase n=1 Tax=Carnobacterium iners TaxID=1073423 RepID=A0A1X7MVT2_9LACT|nr:ribonucleotide-diphosphate reductase subunit beta [Carnobacterium iners]SEK56158.1 ribonucleoside-diphosphate reductase beta chain [Carnobacterium iners]SMH28250.1 ribonucleoside-diphosphate reductase beta chain [Carnobacterium iners]
MSYLHYKAINWNEIEDNLDHLTWEKLTSLFWLDTRIPVSNDKKNWDNLSETEKDVFKKALIGLASIATFQSEKGYLVIKEGQHTQQETAIYNNIQFIESVHAKAYNTILIEFEKSKEVEMILNWAEENSEIQYKLDRILEIYKTGSTLQKRAANLILEGILTCSGSFTPLMYWTQSEFLNVSEIIKLVLMNESLHCFYISHKFRLGYSELPQQEKIELREWVLDLITDLVNNELSYVEKIYNGTGWLEEVKAFVQQQANKVLTSLDFNPLYPEVVESNTYIDSINNILEKVTHHDEITYQSSVSLKVDREDVMSEEDYNF